MMNKKKLILVVVLSIFILGMVLGPVEAKTKYYKKYKAKAKKQAIYGGDKIKHTKHYKKHSYNKHTGIHNYKVNKHHYKLLRHGFSFSPYKYKVKTTPNYRYWYEGCYYYK